MNPPTSVAFRTHGDVAFQMEQYLTTKQVSERTGIPVSTLRYYRAKGIGPESHVQGKSRVVYKLSKLQEWLVAQESNGVRGGVAS
ncbi:MULTISPECIES: helix-turn-helix transcriptional regulator [Rhodococcus]|uniref:helix-turn-helix transcriptional regulator n=1 Tax=Rhodococcus TaxID=1827 RepID=UPI0024B7E8D0|nr:MULTISPECIES: MerR family DNA-binding transcriptional regulator [Rhodococcus]MDI9941803.1 MerR family DNA-binding transcriptional regulator [Rhodococcus sp. IEGM 1302]MEA1798333.1 MerR family DNA-binding transcriptional regulator [Rhodococcus qingshengii]